MWLVDAGAIQSNFTFIASEDANSSQLGDGSNESVLKSFGIGCEEVHGRLGSWIGEQSLIRGEQALPLLEVLEVDVVKCPWCVGVHVNGDSGVHLQGTHLSQLQSIRWIQCWVNTAFWTEVIDSFGESAAV